MRNITVLLVAISVATAGNTTAQIDTQNPTTARDYYERGLRRQSSKQLEEALADYRKAAELDPGFFDAHFSRSCLCADMKDYRGAIEALTASLKARPRSYSALFNRGLYHEQLHEYEDAVRDYTQALAEDADCSYHGDPPNVCRANAYHYRGRVYQWRKKDFGKAIADYTEALRLNPAIEMVHYRRGQAYHSVKEYAKAHADFETACERDPDYANLLNAWAWQLATCPDATYRDGQMALQLAKKTNNMDTLAAAYAETGAFDDAAASQKLAIERLDRATEARDEKAVERRKERRIQMEKRLAAYEAKQPYRDE